MCRTAGQLKSEGAEKPQILDGTWLAFLLPHHLNSRRRTPAPARHEGGIKLQWRQKRRNSAWRIIALPSSRYTPSARPYHGLEELEYPLHDWTAVITTCGRICDQRRKINASQVFSGAEDARQTDRRSHLAGHVHGLRFGILRR